MRDGGGGESHSADGVASNVMIVGGIILIVVGILIREVLSHKR
jgi:hypothetical protein